MGRFSIFNVVDSIDYVFGIVHFSDEKTIPEKIRFLAISKPSIFIFPHAGGSNYTYQKLEVELLPFFIPKTLCYPGRGSRFSEKLPFSIEELVSDMVGLLKKEDLQSTDFHFLGHSFGSLVLFETLRKMRADGLPMPQSVYVSGRKAPSIPYSGKYWSLESDRDFVELLKSKGGIPNELYQNKEFLEIFLPIIRADFKLLEEYQYTIQDPFDLPFHVVNGDVDTSIVEAEIMEWQKESNRPCQFEKISGGHFYLLDHVSEFVSTLFGVTKG